MGQAWAMEDATLLAAPAGGADLRCLFEFHMVVATFMKDFTGNFVAGFLKPWEPALVLEEMGRPNSTTISLEKPCSFQQNFPLIFFTTAVCYRLFL